MQSSDHEIDSVDLTANSTENLTKTLLAINRAYQEVIVEKLEKLRTALVLNLQKQNEIGEKICSINQNLTSSKIEGYKFELEISKIKGNYFKDRFQSEPEHNIDTIRRSKLVYYDYVPQLKSEWTIDYRNKLKQAVIKDSIRITKNPITNKIKFLDEKFDKLKAVSRKSSELKSLKKMIRECGNQIKKIDSMSDVKILENIDAEKIDWLKISNVDLNENWSANECKLVWINVCDPRINQNKWTQEENSQLIDLAREFNEKNWEQISIKLNTNRSAFLCMKRYHEKTVDRYCKRDWTEEESNILLELVECYREGYFVPYNYLCYLNGTRDRNNVFIHHQKIDPNLNHGRWTSSEYQAFEEAVQYFSAKNWQEISEYVGTRTALQCKERYELKFLNPDKYKNWTIQEDKKLLDLVDKYGGQWSKIAASEFPYRTDHSCLFRYTKLMKWKRQNEWFESQPEKIQEFIKFLFKKRKSKNDNHDVEIYTEKGEMVPTTPKFGSGTGFLASMIDKIFEQRDLVEEFIDKKREGQLSLTILAKIGIYTPVVTNLIAKYKKYQLKNNEKTKQPGKKRGRKPKSAENEKKQESIETSNFKQKKSSVLIESGRIKRKYTRRAKIVRTFHSNNRKSKEESNFPLSINYYLKKNLSRRRKRKAKTKKFISQMNETTINEESTNTKSTKKLGKLKISEIFNIVEANNNVLEETEGEAVTLESIEKIEKLLTSTTSETSQETKSNKRKLTEKNSVEPAAKRKYKPRNKKVQNETLESPTTSKDALKPKRGRKKIIRETQPSSNDENIKFVLENKSSLLVDVNSISETTKIACFSEYPNEFKYMYSLKKDANFMKHFTIIKCKDTLVGIKPLNRIINDEYFTEPRLKAIENAMKKMSLLR
ncbi:snRNA-activating complex subunit 4 isoform X1 [Brachionus plicatilis]|uniref:snRNA-activating complex subunit 4 isoform X1 n=1 Tax=Brachionus plicatilis TaxID=10195 RepID=A0A3M7SN95_BRAPC|nr:snRNA-activating complex subunit 4 isoform X1 [Brachionus plicatilis]